MGVSYIFAIFSAYAFAAFFGKTATAYGVRVQPLVSTYEASARSTTSGSLATTFSKTNAGP
jgi:hypothetical protein